MRISYRAKTSYQDEHGVIQRWASTDAFVPEGDMLLHVPPCRFGKCAKLLSLHHLPNWSADNGAVIVLRMTDSSSPHNSSCRIFCMPRGLFCKVDQN